MPRAALFPIIEGGVDVSATIQDPLDNNSVCRYLEDNRHAPLKANHSKSGPQVIAARATFCKFCEADAIGSHSLRIGERTFSSGLFDYIIVELEEVRLSFR